MWWFSPSSEMTRHGSVFWIWQPSVGSRRIHDRSPLEYRPRRRLRLSVEWVVLLLAFNLFLDRSRNLRRGDCHIHILCPMQQRMVYEDEGQHSLFGTITRHAPEYSGRFQARSSVWPCVNQTLLGVPSRGPTRSSNTCSIEARYQP